MRFFTATFLIAINLFFHTICDAEKITYFYAHGCLDNQHQVTTFTKVNTSNAEATNNPFWIIDNEQHTVVTVDFPDAKKDGRGFGVYRHFVNFGQYLDIAAFDQEYAAVKDKKHVVIGLSRGAVTAITHGNLNNARAVIFESPFESLFSIIKAIVHNRLWLPFNTYTGRFVLAVMLKIFPLLDVHGPTAREFIKSFPLNVPILFVHSKQDKVVLIESSRRLYKALVERGHADVYLLELEHGSHGKLMKGSDAQLYQDVVHAFYQKYNLPYEPLFAERGTETLQICQPSLTELAERK